VLAAEAAHSGDAASGTGMESGDTHDCCSPVHELRLQRSAAPARLHGGSACC
jgi:hypothetical protein